MMNPTFFVETEDLLSIISKKFKNINKVKKISTGWTNIVLEIEDDGIPYIIRLPRNDFFSKQIKKDVLVNQFLRKEINLKTTDMSLEYHNGRPYSVHKKIAGKTMTERFKHLSQNSIDNITSEIALFYSKIHNINKNKIPKELLNVSLADFLIELSKVDDDYYDLSSLIKLKEEENKESVFCHGDLNIGNILLDDNDKIVAIIDFSFSSMSARVADISRISCRVPDDFLKDLINKYESINSIKIDMEKIKEANSMWKYVEEQYIVYMKKYQPEIELPEGV